MKKSQMMFLSVVCLLAAAFAATGCSFASVSSKPGMYSMNGYSTNPEMAAQVMSENYVNEVNANEYWKAVREGRAYPYPGGGYGNDYQYYFGSQGYAPGLPQSSGVAPSGGGTGQVTPEQLDEVRQMAVDGLRMHKKLREKLEPQDAAPAGQ